MKQAHWIFNSIHLEISCGMAKGIGNWLALSSNNSLQPSYKCMLGYDRERTLELSKYINIIPNSRLNYAHLFKCT